VFDQDGSIASEYAALDLPTSWDIGKKNVNTITRDWCASVLSSSCGMADTATNRGAGVRQEKNLHSARRLPNSEIET
jgi:hypothetical protein